MRGFIKHISKKFKYIMAVGAEIGVYSGDNAAVMLNVLPIKHLFLVDIWKCYPDTIDIEIKYGYSNQKFMDELCNKVHNKFSDKINVSILKFTSKEASVIIPNDILDFVYIDANHRYEHVLNDCLIWYPKIKHDGAIGGHDWNNDVFGKDIQSAVRDFMSNYNIHPDKLHITHDDWYID